jgi:peptidase M50B-like protein
MSTDLHATAVHEAGHAIVAWSLCLQVHSVSINPDNVREGETKIVGTADHLPLEDQMAVIVGGRAAAHVLDVPAHPSTYHGDTRQMYDLLKAVPEEEHSAVINEGSSRAYNAVVTHRTRLVQLAGRLSEALHIDAADFARLMTADNGGR